MERHFDRPLGRESHKLEMERGFRPRGDWRNWLRFDLRDLALLVVVAALVCHWLKTPTPAMRQTGRELDAAISPGTEDVGGLSPGGTESSPAKRIEPQLAALFVLCGLVCWLWVEVRSLRRRLDNARRRDETAMAWSNDERRGGEPFRETPSPSRLALQRAR